MSYRNKNYFTSHFKYYPVTNLDCALNLQELLTFFTVMEFTFGHTVAVSSSTGHSGIGLISIMKDTCLFFSVLDTVQTANEVTVQSCISAMDTGVVGLLVFHRLLMPKHL